ncbi:AMP-binding protein [Dactylosporangium sp. CS-047395]|uniref:AMP-binding protein n=1 Tax=Dactylosporangium sp. CS-047395 TaxID=3239936 RepID=UPI003D923C24
MNARRTEHETTSPAQDRAWFLHQLMPGSAEQNRCRQFAVVGPLDLGAVRRAWAAVSDRHELLRTVFLAVDGRPVPIVQRDADAALEILDLRDRWTWPDSEDVADRLAAERMERPLDPGTGLVAVTLLVLDDENARLLLVADAMICDETSVGIVAEELAAAYNRNLDEHDKPVQYRAVAAVERRRTLEPDPQWVASREPRADALDLPADRERPRGPWAPSQAVRFDWPGRFAQVADAEPAEVLLAALHALLHRYDPAGRIAVAVPVSTRTALTEKVVGPFDNLMVVAVDFAEAATFRRLLRAVHRQVRTALQYRNLPFDHLARLAGGERDPRRAVLYDAVFAGPVAHRPILAFGPAQALPMRAASGVAQADLALVVDRLEPSVVGSLRYRTDMFDHATAERIAAQLRALVEAAIEHPDDPLATLTLDPACASRAEPDEVEHERVHDTIAGLARTHPDAPAVADANGGTVTYADLSRRADAIAAAIGDATGAPIAVRIAPSAAFAAAATGVLRAGGHLICLATEDSGERDREILRGLAPRCLLVDEDSPFATWYRTEGTVIDVTTVPDAPPPRAAGSSAAYIAYTSGSTGVPKGIRQTHAALAQFTHWFAEEFGIGPGVRLAQWAAPGYDASLMELFAGLTSGATVCPVPDGIRGNPEKLLPWLIGERITVLQTVPSFARELRRTIAETAKPPELRTLLLAGEPLPGALANDLRALLPGIRLVNLYGPTETILATWHEVRGDVSGTVPIGRAIPGRHVEVLDERGAPCPDGVTGDLVIRSPYVTPGYVGVEARPAHLFPGPYYRTGDRARRRYDGALEFRGRTDLQIKFFGRRLELAEIEAALAEHESVAACAVLPLGDQEGLVTRIVAYVVPRTQPAPSTDVWRTHVRRRFGKAKLPLSFRTVTALPRTAGGKVDRHRLAAGAARTATRAGNVRKTMLEKALGEIWRRLLGGRVPATDDTFAGLGGHSLLLLRLAAQIRDQFGAAVPLWELAANPTLSDLAALVEEAVVATAKPFDRRPSAEPSAMR